MKRIAVVGRKAPDEELFTEKINTETLHPDETIDFDIVQKFTVVQSSETAEHGVE